MCFTRIKVVLGGQKLCSPLSLPRIYEKNVVVALFLVRTSAQMFFSAQEQKKTDRYFSREIGCRELILHLNVVLAARILRDMRDA